MNSIKTPLKLFFKRLASLLFSSSFIGLTIMGNSVIFLMSYIFLVLEKWHNPKVIDYFDAVWWAFATVTTVGYGDIAPQTDAGRVLGILLMLGGTGLFACYTALFANAFLGREFTKMDRKVRVVKKSLETVASELEVEEEILTKTLDELKQSVEEIKNQLAKK